MVAFGYLFRNKLILLFCVLILSLFCQVQIAQSVESQETTYISTKLHVELTFPKRIYLQETPASTDQLDILETSDSLLVIPESLKKRLNTNYNQSYLAPNSGILFKFFNNVDESKILDVIKKIIGSDCTLKSSKKSGATQWQPFKVNLSEECGAGIPTYVKYNKSTKTLALITTGGQDCLYLLTPKQTDSNSCPVEDNIIQSLK